MNAKNELIEFLTQKAQVKCAIIEYVPNHTTYILKINHTEEDFQNFLESLDFEYDEDYGLQELSGTIWLKDGTWCTRDEYDGSEWWDYKSLPEIPESCRR